jgi:hypothetical protein
MALLRRVLPPVVAGTPGLGFIGPAPKLKVLRSKDAVRCDIAPVGLPQQPGHNPVGHDRSRFPTLGLEGWIEVGKLGPEARLS